MLDSKKFNDVDVVFTSVYSYGFFLSIYDPICIRKKVDYTQAILPTHNFISTNLCL